MFRYEDTAPLFRVFDKLFVLQCQYEFTHRLYESALITYQLNYKPCYMIGDQEPVRGKTGHRGHEWGFEGLRQKGWTIFTICAIFLHAWRNGYNITVLGQGDNQVVCLEIPFSTIEAMTKFVQDYIASLSAYLESIGLPLKPQETFYGSQLLVYGKSYFFDGVEVSSIEKRVRGLMPEANDSIPTLGMELATVSTSGEGMARSYFNPIPGLVLSYTTSIWYLNRCLTINLEDPNFCAALMLYGRVMGRLPISPAINYFYRGLKTKLLII